MLLDETLNARPPDRMAGSLEVDLDGMERALRHRNRRDSAPDGFDRCRLVHAPFQAHLMASLRFSSRFCDVQVDPQEASPAREPAGLPWAAPLPLLHVL